MAQNLNNTKEIKLPKKDTIIVKPIKGSTIVDEKRKITIFPHKYSNIFICAKRNSGKSTLIHNILQRLINKYTIVVIFAQNLIRDECYEDMIAFVKKKFEILNPPDTDSDTDTDTDTDSDTEEEEPQSSNLFTFTSLDAKFNQTDTQTALEELKGYQFQNSNHINFVIIFDDFSSKLRAPIIAEIMKMNRHMHANILISSQWPNDLVPASILNLQCLILFKGHPDDKLKWLITSCDLQISFQKFKEIYDKATSRDHGFLYIDVDHQKYYNQFSSEFLL